MRTLPNRHSFRLRGYDYSQSGFYFVTICTRQKMCVLSKIIDDEVHLSEAGKIAQTQWNMLPERFQGVALDLFVIMPNHIHGLVQLTCETAPLPVEVQSPCNSGPKAPSPFPILGEIIRTFKAAAAFTIRNTALPEFSWQRLYHESVVRNNAHLERIRQYIFNNPARWREDSLYT